MDRLVRRALSGILATFLAALVPVAGLATTTFTAVLDGPTAGTDSPATGSAVFVLNEDETEVAYVIEYSPLTGTETVAHIHNAPPGVVGPLFHGLEFGSPKQGIWPVGPFEVAELRAGRVNVLIHSDIYPAAEIRGDLVPGSASSAASPPAPVVLGNFPNPFNPRTTIRFELPTAGRVRLEVFDVRGRRVRLLLDEERSEGLHEVVWDGRNRDRQPARAGAYLARIETGGGVLVHKMALAK